ncbi:MAG: Flp pilus assembly complex ATPase component TadA [Hyphomicrobiaceae bacterium]|nr:Flp pilus assembly complex ATPase component TadA [Hyphomicrobiaceae bacterium]
MAHERLDELTVRRAQRAREQSGERFDVVLTRLGLISEVELAAAISEYTGIPLISASEMPDAPLLGDKLHASFVRANLVVPAAEDGNTVAVAVADPFNSELIAVVSYAIGRPVEPRIAVPGELLRAIERLYGADDNTGPGLESAGAAPDQASEEDVRRLEDMASEAPIIRLVHDVIARAVEMHASDIHLEPREDALNVRFRIDGHLQTIESLPLSLRAAVTSRVKIMARLNIAERRLPQDGRIRATVRGRDIDLRVSTMPMLGGESVVLRILDRSSIRLSFSALGFAGRTFEAFEELLEQPNGIILVTGPTGSGKTTTLYTALTRLNRPERKVFTVEDPIEYQLKGINQIQVQPRIGLTFAHALRSILRQDPDIIMVGEIRDLETAEMAIQASLTGHLVLSTVHTNSAAATITRLVEMGVEDYLLASSLRAVVAQRLVRLLCNACARPADRPQPVLDKLRQEAMLGIGGAQLEPAPREKTGCPACRFTGYAGRTTIWELLVMSDPVRDCLLGKHSEQAVEGAAKAAGMRSMFQDGVDKVMRGLTTLDEVLRATRTV